MTTDLAGLAVLLRTRRDLLLANWRRQVRELPSARTLDIPTLNDHMPALLEELSAALDFQTGLDDPAAVAEGSATAHGLQRLANAFDIEEVVAEYSILRGCVHDLAEHDGLRLEGEPVKVINRVFDAAIGVAVQTYATRQASEVLRRREEYLAFVAHDLRTPLTAIALAGRVLDKLLPPEQRTAETTRMLKALGRNAQHLERLVAKVLDENANLQSDGGFRLVRREIDLWPLVENLMQSLHPVAGTSGTRLVNDVPDDLTVHADAGLLARVLQNLVANAIKYAPGGCVTVTARSIDDERSVECLIRDDGAGIPPDLIGKIFEKGETDADTEDGMGLGLAIVKTLVEAHGGEVSVVSLEGRGSSFRFTLPARSTTGSL